MAGTPTTGVTRPARTNHVIRSRGATWIADRAKINSGPIAAIADINLDYAGYGIVALFLASWLAALLVWRLGRIEEKWSAELIASPSPD